MSDKPVRIRLSRRKGWRLPDNTAVVARPTKWGNPFVVGVAGTREECAYLYRMLMRGMVCLTCKTKPDAQLEARNYVARQRHRLRGKNLACWCPLDQPCHADVLLEVANS